MAKATRREPRSPAREIHPDRFAKTGVPTRGGWHWLRRRRDDKYRLAFYDGSWWRLADAIGRTTCRGPLWIVKRFWHVQSVREPFG